MILKENLGKDSFLFPLIGLLFLIICAHFSVGFYRGDEHYQILEFANYILGKTEAKDLCWEFHDQIRPSLQPYIAATIMRISSLFTNNPFYFAEVLRFVTASFAFVVLYLSAKDFSKFVSSKIVYPIVFTLWFIIYLSVRFSSETWSALAFILCYLLWFRWKNKTVFQFFLLGALAAISFEFRYQTALMSLGFLLWILFIEKEKLKSIGILLLGFISLLLVCTYLDYLFYGEFTFAPYNYFYVNLVEDKVSNFGVSPWYHYVPDLLEKTYFVYGLLILGGAIYFSIKNPKNAINFIFWPFVLFHFLIGHKEMRFLFPVIYFSPLFLAYAVEALFKINWLKKPSQIFYVLSMSFLLFMVLFFSFNPIVKVRQWISENANNGDVIYVIEDNPYDRGIPFNYYNSQPIHKALEINNTDEISENKKGETYLFVSNKKRDQAYSIPKNARLIFQSVPVFLTDNLNINGWTDRTTIARLYKLEK